MEWLDQFSVDEKLETCFKSLFNFVYTCLHTLKTALSRWSKVFNNNHCLLATCSCAKVYVGVLCWGVIIGMSVLNN